MKLFLLSVFAVQLFACNKLLLEGTILNVLNNIRNTENSVEVITTHQNVSLEECVASVKQQQYREFSFTLASKTSTQGNCQILTQQINDCAPVDHQVHHDHVGGCNLDPCKHDGVCKAKENNDFECSCHYPMGGKTCEDLICASCYRKDDMVIFLNTTMRSTTWSESYEYCASRGQTLFLDKTQEKHDFLHGVLRNLYPNTEEKIAFWIGVNRTSSSSRFEYIDGTPLSSYTPWATGRPQSELCVEVANGPQFGWNWDDENCDENYPGWRYYPLCEKKYPFLLN